MRYSFYLILIVFIFQGPFSGCRSGHPDGGETEGPVNQVDREGQRHGIWELRSDSVLLATGRYEHGQQSGLWTFYYSNGHMKEEGNYRDGLKNGIWVEWYPDGEIMWKGEWDRGARQIEQKEAKAKIVFMGTEPSGNFLEQDTIYDPSIRITNIPTSHLFVEVNQGTISGVDHTDHFILHTSHDTVLTLAVGYIPDLQFPDFRNLVQEFPYQIR